MPAARIVGHDLAPSGLMKWLPLILRNVGVSRQLSIKLHQSPGYM